MRKITISVALAMCSIMTGCREYNVEDILLHREDISLTVKGETMLTYIPDSFQLGYNAEKNEFRAFDDSMGDWFVLKCDERPAFAGQELKADLSWTTPNNTKTRKGLTFRVEKTGAGGLIWLWCEDESIGVVVKEL